LTCPAGREIQVSLPDREYELAARLMADAIAEAAATGEPAIDTLRRIAAERGRAFGQTAISARGRPVTAEAALNLAVDTLRQLGYEPRRENDRVVMVNCPFHALAQAQTQLVCDMNHALIGGMATTLEPHCPAADRPWENVLPDAGIWSRPTPDDGEGVRCAEHDLTAAEHLKGLPWP
jgi:predicted ArsR family transcriptional regulator